MLILTGLLLSGCAEPPITQWNAATQAIQDARMSGAEDYAIERFTETKTAYHQVEEELNNQENRIPFFRNYDPAITMLTGVLNHATQPKMEAIDNKKESKANAEAAINFAKHQLQTVRALLAEASTPATNQRELDQLLRAFQDTETLLAEIEPIMTQENFNDVMTSSHSVESLATRIHDRILSVRQLEGTRPNS